MSDTVTLLVGLLVLAYLGGALVGKRATRDFGLASGAEYIVLGFLLGPMLLKVIDRGLLEGFAAIARMGAAWLALLAGLGHGVTTRRSFGRASLGMVLTALVGASVAATIWFGSTWLWPLPWVDRATLALGAALLCCATTHNVSPWFAGGGASASSLTLTLRDLARASALIPAVALSLVLALAPGHGLVALPVWGRAGATLGTGVILGTLATLLLGREFRSNESWGLLLGLSLLAAGMAFQLELSAVAVTFCMGLTVSLMSRHAQDIRAMVSHTEKAVMLPVALLAGASIVPAGLPWYVFAGLVGAALGARLLAELVRGFFLWAIFGAARRAGPWLGLAMTTTGGFTLAAGIELHHGLGEPLGSALLLLGAVGAIVGAVLGPLQLRRSLARAGELDEVQAAVDLARPPDSLPSLPPVRERDTT
jgi:hypothetical protein